MGDRDDQTEARKQLYKVTDTAPIYDDDREVLRRIRKIMGIPGYLTLRVVLQRQDPPLMTDEGALVDVEPLYAGEVEWGTPNRARIQPVKNMRLGRTELAVVRRFTYERKSTLVDTIHLLITSMDPVEGEVLEEAEHADPGRAWALVAQALRANRAEWEQWQMQVDAQVMGTG